MAGMSDRPASIRIASLNVCGLPSRLAPLADRATRFGGELDASTVDVVNLQEVWTRPTLAVIRRYLPSYRHVAWRRGLTGQPAGGLVTFSRVPVGAVSYTSFAGIRAGAGGLRFRLGRAVNSMLQGVLVVELPDLRAVVTNTHLSANHDGDWSAGNRYHPFQRAQLERVHAVVRRVAAPLTVLTGDFNIAGDGPLYPLIVGEAGWRDPFRATDPATYHAEFLPPGAVGHRIDYLLVAGDPDRYPILDSEVLFAEPLVLPDGGRMYVSDHVGLSTRIGLGSYR
jgi:exonuclease III